MAQPVFEEHPLESYLREVGEVNEVMPGTSSEFSREPNNEDTESHPHHRKDWALSIVTKGIQVIYTLSAAHRAANPNPFVERFKYDVISSNLLSTTLTSSHIPTPSVVPGQLSPTPSKNITLEEEAQEQVQSIPRSQALRERFTPHLSKGQVGPLTGAVAVLVALFSAGWYIVSALILAAIMYYFYTLQPESVKSDTKSSLDVLHELVAAGDVWDSVVHEAITVLETEERSLHYGPTTPSSPSSNVRVSLLSSLHTTETQCDNVRQVISALTSPAELSQLSEMYAPPSPMKPSHDLDLSQRTTPVRSSASNTQFARLQRHNTTPTRSKRSTWNGAYATLGHVGSLSAQTFKKRDKRASEISPMLHAKLPTSPLQPSHSAPVTPMKDISQLTQLKEEEDLSDDEIHPPHFGRVALDMHRKHKSSGLETLGFSPSSLSYFNSFSPSSRLTGSAASRFTTLQSSGVGTPRHPLSLSSLHHALQGAIASKRYACSHLLALRFNEEKDDEAYWEDVRSVMSLLTSTFVDAASRLEEALVENEKQREKDGIPSAPGSRTVSGEFGLGKRVEGKRIPSGGRPVSLSFAPMPSHLSRFAAHVDSISTALNDAKDHLRACLTAMREESTLVESNNVTRRTSVGSQPSESLQESAALQAYDRLRRELGLALRECERGRERLLDVLTPPNHRHDDDDDDDSDNGHLDDLPSLRHDAGSDESDKPESSPVEPLSVQDGTTTIDDASTHLLLSTSSMHLPPPGIEQIYESEEGGQVLFARERSKLSREERIQMVKARRESAGLGLAITGLSTEVPTSGIEQWGPGGEVVQELKDVIWKVGERRRKLIDEQATFHDQEHTLQ